MIRSQLLRRFFWYYLWVALLFAAGVTVLCYFALLTEFARRAGNAPQYSVEANFILSALKTPLVVQATVPFLVLFASMTTLILLNRARELVVARSMGLSAWQFLVPFCLGSFLIGLLTVTMINPATSRATLLAEQMEMQIRFGKTEQNNRQEMRWMTRSTGDGLLVIGAKGLAGGNGRFDNVTVLQLDTDRKFVQRLDADQAVLESGFLRLENVTRSVLVGKPQTLSQLLISTDLNPEDVTKGLISPDAANVYELPDLIRVARNSGLPSDGFATRLQALIAQPFLLIAMTLIAAAVSMRFARAGQSAVAAFVGVLAGFIFYVVSTLFTASAGAGLMSPVLAAWLPVGVAASSSVWSLLHTEDG